MPLQCDAFIHLSNFRALKNLLLIGCLLMTPHLVALAEKADRQKPMNVESDNLEHDELKQTSLFTGKVLATKGSITMRGDRIEVRQDPDGYQFGVIKPLAGQLAFSGKNAKAWMNGLKAKPSVSTMTAKPTG